MPLACKLCVAAKGLLGSEIANLPKTEEELFDHIEKVHHMPVIREGETEETAQTRFLAKYPEVMDCDHCKEANAPWL